MNQQLTEACARATCSTQSMTRTTPGVMNPSKDFHGEVGFLDFLFVCFGFGFVYLFLFFPRSRKLIKEKRRESVLISDIRRRSGGCDKVHDV